MTHVIKVYNKVSNSDKIFSRKRLFTGIIKNIIAIIWIIIQIGSREDLKPSTIKDSPSLKKHYSKTSKH